VVELVTGALAALVVAVAYLLVLQAMTAAMILLARYILRQARALRSMLAEPSRPAMPEVEDQHQHQPEPYRIGGGLMRWH
jgi:hypothetical protein